MHLVIPIKLIQIVKYFQFAQLFDSKMLSVSSRKVGLHQSLVDDEGKNSGPFRTAFDVIFVVSQLERTSEQVEPNYQLKVAN